MALDYFPKCYILECESVRIGENIQNEILGGKIIFADVLFYQLITSTLLTDKAESLKVNGSRKKKNRTSFYMEQLQAKK